MTTRIMVTTDGSSLSQRAVPVAAALARAAGATVEVLCVGDEGPIQMAECRDAEHSLVIAQMVADAVARELRAQRIQAEAMAVVDDPTEGILRFAEARAVRLIVMATHGRGGVLDRLFGGTAERVVRFGPCPVVVISPDVALALATDGAEMR